MLSLRLPTSAFAVARRAQAPRRAVVVRSGDGDVQSLLARDKKKVKVDPELENVFATTQRDSAQPAASPSTPTSEVVKSRRKRREEMAAAASAAVASSSKGSGPKKCKEAIDQGLELFQKKQYNDAIAMFNLALELPGNGAYRLASSPREYSCPSDAEENAALYNLACCYSQLGQKAAAITCIEAILENGFDDYKTIRTDPDLAPVRGTELELLLLKFENPVAQVGKGVFGAVSSVFGGKEKVVVSDPNQKKPWVMW